VRADQQLTYTATAINDAGFTQLEGLEVVAGRVYTIGRLPPSYDRHLLELASTGVRSLYSVRWSEFSGGDWLTLAGANDDHVFLKRDRDSYPTTPSVYSWTPAAGAVSLGTAQRDPRGITLIGPAMRRGVLFATADGDAGLRLAIGNDTPNAPTLLEPRGCLQLQLVQVLPEVAYVACFSSDSASQLWKTDGVTSSVVFAQGGGGLYQAQGRPLAPEGLDLFGGVGWLLTNGTEAGTRAVALGSSVPARLGDRLYFAGKLGQWYRPASGYELFSISVDQLFDTTPPTITCPPPITIVRPADATSVTLTFPPVTATDDRTPAPELSVGVDQGEVYQLSSPNTASLGFNASASDLAGNTASCEVLFKIVTEQPDAGQPTVDAGQPDAGAVTPEPRPRPSSCGCASTRDAMWLPGAAVAADQTFAVTCVGVARRARHARTGVFVDADSSGSPGQRARRHWRDAAPALQGAEGEPHLHGACATRLRGLGRAVPGARRARWPKPLHTRGGLGDLLGRPRRAAAADRGWRPEHRARA
jgi:hypothetical protein